jgi:predicted dehydrogenase
VEVDVVINGEKGSIVADCFHTGVYYIGKPHHNYAFYYVSGNAHYTPSLDEFANAVNERRNPLVSLDVHRNTIEVVRACYESIHSGKVVHID